MYFTFLLIVNLAGATPAFYIDIMCLHKIVYVCLKQMVVIVTVFRNFISWNLHQLKEHLFTVYWSTQRIRGFTRMCDTNLLLIYSCSAAVICVCVCVCLWSLLNIRFKKRDNHVLLLSVIFQVKWVIRRVCNAVKLLCGVGFSQWITMFYFKFDVVICMHFVYC